MHDQQAEQMIALLIEIRDLLKASGGAKAKKLTDDLWLEELCQNPTYHGIDVKREYGKCVVWCEAHQRKPTRAMFVNWLNKVQAPVQVTIKMPPLNVPPAYVKEVASLPKGEPCPADAAEKLSKVFGKTFSFSGGDPR